MQPEIAANSKKQYQSVAGYRQGAGPEVICNPSFFGFAVVAGCAPPTRALPISAQACAPSIYRCSIGKHNRFYRNNPNPWMQGEPVCCC